MTDAESAPRRPSKRRSLLDAVAKTPIRPEARPPVVAAVPEPEVADSGSRSGTPAPRAAPPAAGRVTKSTLSLDEHHAERLDDIVRTGKRKLAQHVDKSMVLRAAIRLMADDASLRDLVYAEIARQG